LSRPIALLRAQATISEIMVKPLLVL
jgi:hypothetical protein